jgi:uncharacterized protein (TIGR03546 family)
MLSAIVAPIRRIVDSLVAANSPSQLAAGFTLGMIIGVVPKSNLIALSLCVLLFSLRCNKGLALASALLFACTTAWIDPFAHKIGLALLTAPSMQANYASFYSLPLAPWSGFNNTVVTGSLILTLYCAFPVYWVVKTICATCQRETVQ